MTELVDDLAHALAAIVRELGEKGYSFIQFNEPGLCNVRQNDLKLAKRGYETLAKRNLHTTLQTYFGDCGEIIDVLLDFPVDCLGVDLYSTSINDLSQYKFNRELNCGCIDGRNSLIESPQHILALLNNVMESVEPRGLSVGPNCDLDFLPYTVAENKAQLLGELRVKLND
jgi:methionine synthase II (cobalamin-independent)